LISSHIVSKQVQLGGI